ncbi:unnamed protein product [Strongylus vulgaris]|uniref:Apple domain-containing protein n=1 Tax=Strongylus vulgaris TaxID=40348 RepID=A0A3P7J1X5_STRVU|nr:unnamed protein product [Strongylus vulgaris]
MPRCTQWDGCSGAKYNPSSGTCSLAYNDKQFCAKEPVVLHYKADVVTWIHCVNCYSDKNSAEVPTAITPASPSATATTTEGSEGTEGPQGTEGIGSSEQTTTGPEASGSTPMSKKEEEGPQMPPPSSPSKSISSSFQKGCLIKFQARPIEDRPSDLTAPFEIDLPVDSIELCATRCYQDGCSGAKYDPEKKTCSLAYNDKQFCEKGPVELHYDAKNVTWLHCVNCCMFIVHN